VIRKILHTTKKTIKKLLRPIYYSYFGYEFFNMIQRLTGYKKERQRIFRSLGYYPNLKNPQSFNEKVLWKKIYDKNPLLPIISDKYRVREHLKEVLGEKEAEKILVPLFYVTDKPETVPFDNLKEEYIIKPNHASGWYIFAKVTESQRRYTIIEDGKTNILIDCKETRSEIINICKNWLSRPYGFHQHEWAYQKIIRKIIIEKLLRDSNGKIPTDYKFIVFNGKCHSILVQNDRFVDLNRARYTPEWRYVSVNGLSRQAGYQKKPENLQYMIDLAELLSKPFDFVRVDLMLVESQIYFGELTNYPASGAMPYNPLSYDFELGSKWKVVPGYWK
jgi:hypothetical protein